MEHAIFLAFLGMLFIVQSIQIQFRIYPGKQSWIGLVGGIAFVLYAFNLLMWGASLWLRVGTLAGVVVALCIGKVEEGYGRRRW